MLPPREEENTAYIQDDYIVLAYAMLKIDF